MTLSVVVVVVTPKWTLVPSSSPPTPLWASSVDTPLGVVGGLRGSGSCARLGVDCGDVVIASTASSVKSGVPIEGGGGVGNGGWGSVPGDVGGGLADCDVVGKGCGAADGGGACIDLSGGGSGVGWDCSVGEGCLGRGSGTSVRVVGCNCGSGGVEGLPAGVG